MPSGIEVPIPASWYGTSDAPSAELMTFDQAQQALDTVETRRAVALMKEIDERLGLDTEVRPGIQESPEGACVVLMHNIKTPVDPQKLAYIAAVKKKALLDQS
jgi:hypothetical protein